MDRNGEGVQRSDLEGLEHGVAALFHRAITIFQDRARRYGTANISEAGSAGVLARIRDKIARFENVSESEQREVAVDTALDLVNYSVILASLAQGTWPQARKHVLCSGFGLARQPQVEGDVGFDIRVSESVWVRPLTPTYVKTGVRLAMPDGVWCTILGRSSLLAKRQSMVAHPVIDTGYTGELSIPIINFGPQYHLEKGERIAQVIFHRSVTPRVEYVNELPETKRGSNGYGSTGE